MKTKTINLYQFSELSDEAKEKAINNFRNKGNDYFFITDEAGNSFKKFADIFSITNWSIDYCEPYRNEYKINQDEKVIELTGQRLATYIYNNFKRDLYKRQYLKCFDGHKNHKNIVNKTANTTKKQYCFYYSSLKIDTCCVLTGVCYDDDLLKPIYDFLDHPKTNIDFETLLNDCIYSLCHSVSGEIESQYEEENIIDNITANEYNFDEEGNLM